jgi:hypothetical protein
MDKSYHTKMKRVFYILVALLVSFISMAQHRVTLLFDNGMTVKDGFQEGGVQLDLPTGEYEFYIFGERNIVGIERFDSIAQFRGVEKEFLVMYQDKLCDYMGKKGESCGDTEVAYEVHDSPMFGYCQVLYFYYENAMYTNRIGNMWTSMNDGDHTIFVVTYDGIYFTRKIRIKNGKLVEL